MMYPKLKIGNTTRRVLDVWAWLVVNLSRLILSATFIFSGIVKVIDPHGFEYKLIDYGKAFGLSQILQYNIPLILGIAVATIEFLMGVNILFGISRKGTSRVVLLFLLFMTGLTYYLALYNPVADCGCFGDAIVLTNWETFYKNLILLACAVFLCLGYNYSTRVISVHTHWMVSIYALLFAVGIASYALVRLPLIDFRPFHIGADIGAEPEFRTTFILEKDGVQQEFDEKDYPYEDTTWVFVDSRTEQVGQNHDFEMVDLQTGEDISQSVVKAEGYTFLLVMPNLQKADNSMMDALNNLYDYCRTNGYQMYALTDLSDASDSQQESDTNVIESPSVASDVDSVATDTDLLTTDDVNTANLRGNALVEHWRDMTGSEYPFCQTDELTLKTMVRSNPGLLLLKDGVVINKWSRTNIPTEDVLTAPLDSLSLNKAENSQYGGSKEATNGEAQSDTLSIDNESQVGTILTANGEIAYRIPLVGKVVSVSGWHNTVTAIELFLAFFLPVFLLVMVDRIWFAFHAVITAIARCIRGVRRKKEQEVSGSLQSEDGRSTKEDILFHEEESAVGDTTYRE